MSRPTADVLEDLVWLDEARVGAVEAARRADFPSPMALEKWLHRHGEYPLWLRLKNRDPEGTHLSGSDRKKERLMSVPNEAVDATASLLASAAASDRKRIRSKGEKVAALIEELREALEADREEAKVREQARKEIETLERQLADARARLRGGPGREGGDGVSAAELRAWAAANGIDCPPVGRVPGAVREAFEVAQRKEAS